jgi:hypothetical protein
MNDKLWTLVSNKVSVISSIVKMYHTNARWQYWGNRGGREDYIGIKYFLFTFSVNLTLESLLTEKKRM